MLDFPSPEIDPELCRLLGRVVTKWTAAEYLASLLLGTFMMADQAAVGLVANSIGSAMQVKWMRAFMKAHEHEADDNKRVVELLNRFDEIRQERNELVHGAWEDEGCEKGTALVLTTNLDRAEIIKQRLVTVQDLTDLCRDIDQWMHDYVVLGRELGFPRHRGATVSMFMDEEAEGVGGAPPAR